MQLEMHLECVTAETPKTKTQTQKKSEMERPQMQGWMKWKTWMGAGETSM